jgi:hypothetical protein
MTLLIRDTETKTEAPAGPDGAGGGAAPETPAPVATSCPKCGAPVEPGQDWCLNCGEAQASRRFMLPGKRATATVLALTTVLVGGAVGASYAALDHSSPNSQTTPTQVAQVPAAAPTPSVAAPATASPSTAVPSGALPPTTGSTVTPPATGSTSAPRVPSTPVTPPVTSTPTTPPASNTTTRTSTGSRTDTTSTTRTSTTTTPADTAPVAIRLDQSAAALYDPYRRDTADPTTSFPVTVADGSTSIGAGLDIDLGRKQGVRELDITTKTPGFKIEIYATDETTVPPDITDTRWAHLKDVRDVGSDATDSTTPTKVDLGAGTTKYRHVLLWFTTPPTTGFTVRISEVRVLG